MYSDTRRCRNKAERKKTHYLRTCHKCGKFFKVERNHERMTRRCSVHVCGECSSSKKKNGTNGYHYQNNLKSRADRNDDAFSFFL